MIRRSMPWRPKGIRVLIIASDADYVRHGEYIKKTVTRIMTIGGFAVFGCRPYQLKDELFNLKPEICLIADEQFKREIQRLYPNIQIIVSQFMHSVPIERNYTMRVLEEQLRAYKDEARKSRP